MGYTLEESIKFAMELEKVGVDIMDISPSTAPKGEHAALAGAIKSKLVIPLIAVGGMNDLKKAKKILYDGKCDFVAVGRGLIADPYLPKKVMQGKFNEIVECILCNEKCFGNLRKGISISCTQNPSAGREYLDG
jgi:2,4-dienoyl-CoA reductase-like NADH-dependent reductase (Old Yellow Enzyme family)